MEQSYKIAVIGGTGKAGQYLVRELIRQGLKFKMLVRNPEKVKFENPLIEIVQGDVLDFKSVITLIEGCSAVISTLGQPKEDSPIFSGAALNVIRAMSLNNVKRYIFITGLSIDSESDKKSMRTKVVSKIMRICFPKIIGEKQKEYEIISDSNIDWTMIRVPFIELTEMTGNTKISLTDCPGKKISATGLAIFLISQLTDNQFIRKTPFISN